MKTTHKRDNLPNPRRNTRRITMALGSLVGVALVGSAFASFRPPQNAPTVQTEHAPQSLPREWVWEKKAVNFDDMFRRKPPVSEGESTRS